MNEPLDASAHWRAVVEWALSAYVERTAQNPSWCPARVLEVLALDTGGSERVSALSRYPTLFGLVAEELKTQKMPLKHRFSAEVVQNLVSVLGGARGLPAELLLAPSAEEFVFDHFIRLDVLESLAVEPEEMERLPFLQFFASLLNKPDPWLAQRIVLGLSGMLGSTPTRLDSDALYCEEVKRIRDEVLPILAIAGLAPFQWCKAFPRISVATMKAELLDLCYPSRNGWLPTREVSERVFLSDHRRWGLAMAVFFMAAKMVHAEPKLGRGLYRRRWLRGWQVET